MDCLSWVCREEGSVALGSVVLVEVVLLVLSACWIVWDDPLLSSAVLLSFFYG